MIVYGLSYIIISWGPYQTTKTDYLGSYPIIISLLGGRGSSAVERATPGEKVPGSIPAVAARSLLVGSVLV